MGCGQSKINLYPRRNKGSGKSAHGVKKSGTGDGKDTTEDTEEGGGRGPDADVTGGESETEDGERGRQLLPLSAGNTIEASASQQDFFKMLDEKIDKGRDYDSSSETEMEIEQTRRTTLIQQWRSASQSSSQMSGTSPPTPSNKRTPQQKSIDKQDSPVGRRCLKSQQSQVSETNSPPARRCHSAQGNPYNQPEPPIVEKPQTANNRDWQYDVTSSSPVRRPQSAGSNWKGNPKIAPYGLKTAKRNIVDTSDDQRSYSPSQRELQHAYSQDYTNNSSRDSSQITYNPTFQSHSPAHVSHKVNPATAVPQQPYITQIVSYPVSQQISSNQYISQTQTYHEQTTNTQRAPNQPNIYYIPQNNLNQTPPPSQEQVQLTQKQQTALHLQQYVAMKQAQQNMFGYFQRNVPTATQDFIQSANQVDPNSTIDITEENYGPTYYSGFQQSRPNSAPNMKPPSVTPTKPVPLNPIQMTPLVGHISPLMGHLSPIITNYGPFPPGQIPQTEVQYYHQSQLMHNMYRPGSAGTLTRYPQKDKQYNAPGCNPQPITNISKNNVCQSINIVRQKPVGQIVSLGGQDLGVYQGANENNQIPNVVLESNPCLIKQQSKESVHSVEHVQTGINKCMNAEVVNQTYNSEGNTIKQKCPNSEIKVKKGKTDSVKNGRTHNSSLKNCKGIEVAKSNEQDGYL